MVYGDTQHRDMVILDGGIGGGRTPEHRSRTDAKGSHKNRHS